MLEHGGGLRQAARDWSIAPERWLDLSTGINPNPWPVPPVPPEVWLRLPEIEDGLEDAARTYYNAPHLLPAAGSQALIQTLPRLLPPGRVGILSPTYGEHPQAWIRAGHRVLPLPPHQILDGPLPDLAALVVVNPNNPTGGRLPRELLLTRAAELASRDGWLVVDEAFMDPNPDQSLADAPPTPGLLVLRSLGKFFGLAGARCGFLLAPPALLNRVHQALGPWTLTGPTRFAARLALADHTWQAHTRTALAAASHRLAALLTAADLPPAGGTALFQWVPHPAARTLQALLARQALLVRAFDHPSSLRFGLPPDEAGWQRLIQGLAALPRDP
ncbi:MAG: threonine-phosphate decarboxylase [Magnetococcales bacterium]|nr:threonine-phosphate decarboxylase [Magnetococcales bacterium]